MREHFRIFVLSVFFLVMGSWLVPTSVPLGTRVAAAQGDDQLKLLYENDQLFDQLSGAAQTLLENKFGPRKGKVRNLEESATASPSFTPEPLSALPNPLVNDPAADLTAQKTQSETTIVLGSGSNVIAGFNDSGSFIGGASKFTGYSLSTDSGDSWTDMGTLPTNLNGDAGDPVLARNDTTGRIYFSTLNFSGDGLRVFRSDNDGLTWMAPTQGAPGATGFQDKEWITVDNFPGTGQGNVYLAFRDFTPGPTGGVRFTRSTDNGDTFSPSPGLLLASPGAFNVQGAWVTVGPDHAVYVFWLDQSAGGGTPNIIRMRKSTDQGVSFDAPVTVGTLLTTGVNGSLGSVGGFRTNSFPKALVNPTDPNILYLVYNDITAGADSGNIFFTQSTDGGMTWDPAVQLNTDGGTNLQWSPAIGVKPDGSGLAVTWYDRRNSPTDSLIEFWGVTGAISGTTVSFGPNFRISPQFPAVFGQDPVVNAVYMGDYDQVVADNSFFYATWGDNRLGNPDVRFTKFPMEGPGPVLDFVSSALTGGNGNGVVDPNECNNLDVAVINNGSSTATEITALLSTSTPGVTITQPNSAYPDIDPGVTGTNSTPFQISTSPDFICGTNVALTLTLSYSGGSDVIDLTLGSGAGGDNYTITESTDAVIEPGDTDIGNHCDDCTTTILLPFTYTLYDQTYSSVNASSNGNLQFVSNNAAFENACLPTSALDFAILGHWDDLRTDTAGSGIFTSVSGSAPDRIFNIEWRTTYLSGAGNANFEIRLYEGQTRFDIIYGTVDQAGTSATVGVQRGTGTGGLFTQYECNTGGLTSGLQLAFVLAPLSCDDGGGECVVQPTTRIAAPK